MNSNYLDFRVVQAEIDARYAPRGRRGPRNASLEVIRRTMSRAAREELSPNRPR